MKFRFLGTSDSGGMPVHNCKCIACESFRKAGKTNLATCAVLELEDGVILFDAGAEDISEIFDGKKIKAICLTHFHADHVMGLLRLRYSNDKIVCYHPKDEMGFADLYKHKMSIEYKENTPLRTINIDSIKITPIPLKHSKNTTGYIIETPNKILAYLTDCAGIEEKYIEYLQNMQIDHLFIDACFIPPKKGNHFNYDQAIELIDSLNIKDAHLIHQGHKNLEYMMRNNIELRYSYIDTKFVINL